MEFIKNHATEIIAISAVIFTAWQAFIQRRHNRVSVIPHLFTFTHRDKNQTAARLLLQLQNNGLGPAFIKKFQIFYNGQPCEPDAAISYALGELTKNSQRTALGTDYAMPSKERKTILAVTFPAKTEEDIEKVAEKLDKLDLLVEYQSAYGEKFKLDSRES